MIKIRVQNFQAVEDQTLEVDGFTAITGQNNVGKTAFLRAIRGVFTNTRGTGFVRHGTDHCTVQITFEDGNSVSWQKGKNRNRYRINEGEWFKKVGSGVPEEISAILGIHSLDIGSRTLTPNYNVAGDNVFILNDPGSVLAEAISDVERVGTLNRSLKKAESEKRRAKSTLKVRESDKASVDSHLVEFQGLDALSTQVADLYAGRVTCTKMRLAFDTLTGYATDLAKTQRTCDMLAGVEGLSSFPEEALERCLKASRLISDLESMSADLHKLETAQSLTEALLPILEGLDSTDVAEAQSSEEKLSFMQKMQSDLETSKSKFDLLSQDVLVLDLQIELLSTEISWPSRQDLDSLLTLQKEISRATTDLAQQEQEIEEVSEALGVLQTELAQQLCEFESCPTCGGGL